MLLIPGPHTKDRWPPETSTFRSLTFRGGALGLEGPGPVRAASCALRGSIRRGAFNERSCSAPWWGPRGAAVNAGFLPSRGWWVVGSPRRQPVLEPPIFPLEVLGPDPIRRSPGTRPGRGAGTGQVGPGSAGRAWVGDGAGGHRGHRLWNGKRLCEGAPEEDKPKFELPSPPPEPHFPHLGNGSENLPSSYSPSRTLHRIK